MKTEERIVAKALEMFNKNGIEYVGLRELAALLDMRVSNITYYFPTKDNLVKRITMDLREANSKIVVEQSEPTLLSFLEMFKQVFHNHLKYRCLFLSFVHLMAQNKAISTQYKKTQIHRSAALKANLQALHKSGNLNIKNAEELETIVDMLVLLVRFWVSEATILYGDLEKNNCIPHYAKLLAKVLLPYATAKGKKEINRFIKAL